MDPRSLNRYAYAHGNPVNYQDPSGHDAARQQMVNENRAKNGLTVYGNNNDGTDRRKRELEESLKIATEIIQKALCGITVTEGAKLQPGKFENLVAGYYGGNQGWWSTDFLGILQYGFVNNG